MWWVQQLSAAINKKNEGNLLAKAAEGGGRLSMVGVGQLPG